MGDGNSYHGMSEQNGVDFYFKWMLHVDMTLVLIQK